MNQTREHLKCPLPAIVLLACAVLFAGCANTAKMVRDGDRALQSGDYGLAAQSYKSIAHDERDEDVTLKLAWLYWKQDQCQACLRELEQITQNRPAQADYLAALCYLRQNDLTRARRHTEISLQGDPRNSLTVGLLGQILFLEKQYPQSIEAYRKSLEMASDPSVRLKLHYNLAMAQLAAGDFAAADESFKQYLVRQRYVSSDDNRTAGAIAYARGDHQRAYRHWSQLDPVEKKQILDVIGNESEQYSQLSGRR